MGTLKSVNVGLPKIVDWRGRRVNTGIWKNSVDGRRTVRRLNVDGDGQGDLAGHGGEQRAVFVYQTAAYEFWARTLGRHDFSFGQFGENFTVEGLPDDEVCIGDRYRIGGALFEVTQPRVTCYRLGIRMNDASMPSPLVATGRPGFYLRVLHEGDVGAGDPIELVHREPDGVSVVAVDALLYRPGADPGTIRRALATPALSAGWRGSLQAILDKPEGATGNPGLASGDLAATSKPGFRTARFASLERETADVLSIVLEAEDGSALDGAEPGQYVVLRARVSPGEPDVMRSYSICGAPRAPRYELGVKCEPSGSMGRYLSERARVGDAIDISAPRGSFVLREGDVPIVLASAGIGITPVLAMLKALVERRARQPVWWIYGARNRAEHPFVAAAHKLVSELPAARSHVRYSRPADGDRLGVDYDSEGRVDAGLIVELGVPAGSAFYLCGPPAFLDSLRAGLSAIGVAADAIHSEIFGSRPALRPGVVDARPAAPHAPAAPSGNGPSVSFARSGVTAPWNPTYASLLEFAEACDVPTQWSCRTGVCHTCESGLISGDVAYAPEPLSPAALGNLLICCATPQTDIVLDL